MQTHTQTCCYGANAWTILNSIEQSIKHKVESLGTPLKDWDVGIYRGVLTGFNDAFIIDTTKRDAILNACTDEDERIRTAEIIRPILRGRDIKRYSHEWANLWLVWIPWHFPLHLDPTIQGASEVAENEFKKQYPAVYKHLLHYKTELSARNKAETGIRYEWYAMQRWGANYWDEFSKPKIVWGNLNTCGSYAIAPQGMLINAPACMIVPGDNYLLAHLNSKIADYYIRNLGVVRNGGFFEYKPMFVEQIPVPKPTGIIEQRINEIFGMDCSQQEKEALLEDIIESQYGFTEEEVTFLRNQQSR